MSSWTREFTIDFINLYRSQECLWKMKSRDYSNRSLKERAYGVLIDKLKEIDVDANREKIVKKINILRSSFRKELRKVQKSQLSGAATEDVYVPRLWYYQHLLFLVEQEVSFESGEEEVEASVEVILTQDGQDQQSADSLLSVDASYMSSNTDIPEGNLTSPEASCTIHHQQRSKKRCKCCPKEKRDDHRSSMLSLISDHWRPKEDDRFDITGKHLALKLKGLPNDQRIYAEKLINDVLFEAELGNLNRSFHIASCSSSDLPKVDLDLVKNYDSS